MAKLFSFRPSLTLKGRRFMGLRGFTGKPFHPPLTDVPIGAYVLAAAFDVVSSVFSGETWARDLFRAGTYVMVGGAIVGVGAVVTGAMDWWKSTPKGTQVRRTVNAHAITMIIVQVAVAITIQLRIASFDEPSTPLLIAALTVLIAAVVAAGATIGGSLVFDYGFNVTTAADSPVWHESDHDQLPGRKPPPPS